MPAPEWEVIYTTDFTGPNAAGSGWIGVKMIATAVGVHIPIQISLLVIVSCPILAVAASLIFGRRHAAPAYASGTK